MKVSLKISLLLTCLLLLNTKLCKAQDSTPSSDLSGITLAVIMPASIDGLDNNSVSLMGNKIVNILTNEGVASGDENKNFTLNPTFQIGSVTTTAGTLKKLYIANCTFGMFIKQGSTKLIFASYSKLIQGTGFTKEEAVQSAVTSISNDEAGISKFIDRGKQKIGAYYQENCQQFMLNADHEIAKTHYDAAKAILEGIPHEAGDCYLNAQKKIGDIFTSQFGSLEKATTYFQAKAVVNPDDEGIKKKLEETKKIAELRSADDKTPPVIALLTPKVSRGQGVEADVKADQIYVSGIATDPSGIALVSVNGQVLEGVRPDGFFQANVNSTATDITIQATDKKGNAGSEVFHIASKVQETATKPDEIKPLSDDEKFHAIFLANSSYSGGSWPALNTTVGEAKQLRQLFIDKYNFAPENIDTVFNKNKIDMLTAISNVMAKLGDNDNLIIFYGGHGYFTEATNIAYWVPIGAERDFEYISNTEITNLIANCQAKHILIMADACFSGAMRGGLSSPSKYEYKFKSRQLLTSGGTEPVPGKSAYVQMVLEALKNNEDKYVSARELYARIAKGIMDQTKTEPTIRDLNVVGSMGGQFYFRKN